MVLYLKFNNSDKYDYFIDIISKQIINLETNKQYYNLQKKGNKKKFNIYKSNNITYEFNCHLGIILF